MSKQGSTGYRYSLVLWPYCLNSYATMICNWKQVIFACSRRSRTSYSPYWPTVLDHLAAHRAGLTARQVTVVTVLQVHANFLGSLHLELLHSSLSLGNIDLIVTIAHSENSPFSFVDGISRRKHSLTLLRKFIDVSFRKTQQKMEI